MLTDASGNERKGIAVRLPSPWPVMVCPTGGVCQYIVESFHDIKRPSDYTVSVCDLMLAGF